MKEAGELYHFTTNAARRGERLLFQFLSGYRSRPWLGFGSQNTTSGYTSPKWWLDAAGNIVRQNQNGFVMMRILISNQR